MRFLRSCVLILFLTCLVVSCQILTPGNPPPKAIKGVLDLRGWNLEKDGPVELWGDFEFFWKRLVEPFEFSADLRTDGYFIPVPGYWSHRELKGKRLPGQGFATYRLVVLLDGPEESLALRFQSIGTAFVVFVNGQKLGAVGIPGKSRETTVPRFLPQVMPIDQRTARLDIVFQVSNFHHRRGGIWEGIQLGKEDQLREMRERRVGIDLFLFGSIFIIALYHFGLFLVRRQDRAPLYFALFCAAVSVRILTTGERYLTHIFPNINWEFFLKLEYLSISLAVPAFALFMNSLYPKEFWPPFLRSVVALSVAVSLAVIAMPGRVFSHLLPVCDTILLATFLFGFIVLIRAVQRARNDALIFLAGFVILSLAAVNDILHVEKIIETGFFAAFGLFVFIFSQAVILSLRFSRAYSMAESQHQKLAAANEACRREIADRVAVEGALRQSEEKYRSILHSIEDGYYEVNLAGDFVFFNEALCRILGYSGEELQGMNYRTLMKEETAAELYRTFGTVHRTGKPAKVLEWEIMRKDGTGRHLEISASPVRDLGGTTISFRGLARDVTERIESEKREMLHQRQLIQASKMVELGTLVSGVAHEINNPNNFIMLNAPLLMDAWNAARPILEEYFGENGDFVLGGMPYSEMRENVPRLLRGVLEGSGRIKEIVNGLRDYVRQETSDLNQQVDLNAVVGSALSLLSSMVKQSTDRFSVRTSEDLPVIRGNFQRLEQVAINLVQNACQALGDRTKGITLSTRRDRGHVVLIVEDEGVGIAAEDLPRVMDPFFSTKQDFGGVGLGLAISSTIVKQHNGTIQFFSHPGKGTRAEVILPAESVRED